MPEMLGGTLVIRPPAVKIVKSLLGRNCKRLIGAIHVIIYMALHGYILTSKNKKEAYCCCAAFGMTSGQIMH